MQFVENIREYLDYAIWVTLGMMSFVMLWKVLERYRFLATIDLDDYRDIHQLDIDLEQNLTPVYTIGANAPYVGLLGTVLGILLTFYDMGQAGGDIEAGKIMVGLALALKSTALGILVAIPSVMFYNHIARKITIRRNQWLSVQEQKRHEKI